MVLESGFDKELIGSDPNKLSVQYLQNLYNEQSSENEKLLCYGCKKILQNSNKEQLLSTFPNLV
jgi:hypothetical protein